MGQITNKRNQHGVKDQSDCYRTINGQHYECWFDGRTDEFLNKQKKELIEKGYRVLKIKDSLFVSEIKKESK